MLPSFFSSGSAFSFHPLSMSFFQRSSQSCLVLLTVLSLGGRSSSWLHVVSHLGSQEAYVFLKLFSSSDRNGFKTPICMSEISLSLILTYIGFNLHINKMKHGSSYPFLLYWLSYLQSKRLFFTINVLVYFYTFNYIYLTYMTLRMSVSHNLDYRSLSFDINIVSWKHAQFVYYL